MTDSTGTDSTAADSRPKPKYGELSPLNADDPSAEKAVWLAGGSRQAPNYGEYATPLEQATAMGIPLAKATDPSTPAPDASARVSGLSPEALKDLAVPRASDIRSTKSPVTGDGAAGAATAPPPHRVDRFVSAVFLGIGAWAVLQQVFATDYLSRSLTAAFAQMGYGTFTPPPVTSTMDTVLKGVVVLLFVITATVTSRRLRRGRMAFWVPLVGGVAGLIATTIIITILVSMDPSFVQMITKK